MLNAVEFIKTRKRMCNSIHSCAACELSSLDYGCRNFTDAEPERAVEIVENWGKRHPLKTNREKFEEVFGIRLETASWLDCSFRNERLMYNGIDVEKWLDEPYGREEKPVNGST